jgi:hypothetical protein
MARKPHGLLLLFEGLPQTVIQSQVLARVQWLERENVATCDVLSFAHSRSLLQASMERRTTLPEDIRSKFTLAAGVKPALQWSRIWNRRRLASFIGASGKTYDFIHARGDYAAAVAGPLAKALACPMIWDCRGDAEAEVLERWEHSKAPRVLRQWRAREAGEDGRIAAKTAAAASFVSNPLRDKWRTELADTPSFVIPCVADEGLFFYAPELRAKMRAELGYGETDIVFVYSGSLAFYQGFNLMSEHFARVAQTLPQARLLVLTPAVNEAHARLGAFDRSRIIVKSAAFKDVNGYLNAADYGFLLRPVSRTNTAAFPTKFAEYGMAGLKTIVSPSVPDCYAFAAEAGSLVEAGQMPGPLASPAHARTEIMSHFAERLTHRGVGSQVRRLYEFPKPVD